jgi:hypothetical protein
MLLFNSYSTTPSSIEFVEKILVNIFNFPIFFTNYVKLNNNVIQLMEIVQTNFDSYKLETKQKNWFWSLEIFNKILLGT